MVLAVPPSAWPQLQAAAAAEGVEATAIGTFTGSGRLVLRWQGEVAGELDCGFLHEGRPKQRLRSRFTAAAAAPAAWSTGATGGAAVASCLLDVLRLPDVASKEWIIRQYDHEVQGCSVLKPLLGPGGGPADGTVVRGVLGRDRGIVLGVGLRHRLGRIDPYQMAAGGIVEAIGNVVAAGADPDRIALLDNFCWGDTRREESLGTLVEACRACHDIERAGGLARRLHVRALGERPALADDFQILCIPGGFSYGDDIAGTQLELTGRVHGGGLPTVEPAACRAAWAALAATRAAGLLASCHDCSDGGLAAAVAEMAIGGDCGARIDLGRVPLAGDGPMPDLAIAFAETPGRFICEVRPEHAAAFAAQLDRMTGVAWGWIGTVAAEPVVEIMASDGGLAAVPVDRLAAA